MDIKTMAVEEEFHVCTTCGYARGFHVSFQPENDRTEIILICPNCGQRYRVGWHLHLEEPGKDG